MGTLADRIGTSYDRKVVRPRNGGRMLYRYKLHERDGSEAGEAHYAVLIEPGETIWTGDGRHLRVVDLVPCDDDSDVYVGLLMVEPHDALPDPAV